MLVTVNIDAGIGCGVCHTVRFAKTSKQATALIDLRYAINLGLVLAVKKVMRQARHPSRHLQLPPCSCLFS